MGDARCPLCGEKMLTGCYRHLQDGYACLFRQREQATVENKRLQTIVDNLSPKYADTQKPIRCGDTIWLSRWLQIPWQTMMVIQHHIVQQLHPKSVSIGEPWEWDECDCYSTAAAAEAAREKA